MTKKKEEVEVLPDYSCPPFEKDKIYKNRNFGKFRVVEMDKKVMKYEILDNPGKIIEEEHNEIFERICHNSYFEDWRKLNGVIDRLTSRD